MYKDKRLISLLQTNASKVIDANGEPLVVYHRTDIEKGNLIEAANGFTTTGNASVPSYTKSKDKRLISLLQTNASKVIDANGEPLVVYHGTDSDVVFTELTHNGNNFVVVLQVRKSDDSRNIEVEVNDIRSLYPKESKDSILNWINDGLLRWVDKKKATDLFSTQEPNYLGGGKEGNSLSFATKIVEDFENPILIAENNSEMLSESEENDSYVDNAPIAAPNLNSASVEEVQVEKHNFTGSDKNRATRRCE